MLVMMRRHNLGKAFDFCTDGAARDQHVANRQHTLPHCSDRAGHFSRKNAKPDRKVADPYAGEPRFINDPCQEFARLLPWTQAPLGHPRPLRREWVEHHTAADCRHGRKAANDEAITPPRHDRMFEKESRQSAFPGSDRANLRNARQNLRRAEMNANARACREWLAS